jgi:hypothetical protein
MFDQIVIVDWSAANAPKKGKDSIWICRHGETPINLATRSEAKLHLESLLSDAIGKSERTLVGFDFPFGYPAGFAKRLSLSGEPWRATWELISDLVKDSPKNGNNRFEVGARLNRLVSGKQFPFWGCPPKRAFDFLGPRHHRGHTDSESLKEHRLIDCWMTGAQPCWKLAYTGSVGSQVLTGIPVVWALRNNEHWRNHARIWPFETGLQPPKDAAIVFAEVWPSWWKWKETREMGEIADRAQVRHVAQVFAERDRVGELDAWFAPPVPPDRIDDVLSEEAWTLGVVAPRPRRAKNAAA